MSFIMRLWHAEPPSPASAVLKHLLTGATFIGPCEVANMEIQGVDDNSICQLLTHPDQCETTWARHAIMMLNALGISLAAPNGSTGRAAGRKACRAIEARYKEAEWPISPSYPNRLSIIKNAGKPWSAVAFLNKLQHSVAEHVHREPRSLHVAPQLLIPVPKGAIGFISALRLGTWIPAWPGVQAPTCPLCKQQVSLHPTVHLIAACHILTEWRDKLNFNMEMMSVCDQQRQFIHVLFEQRAEAQIHLTIGLIGTFLLQQPLREVIVSHLQYLSHFLITEFSKVVNVCWVSY